MDKTEEHRLIERCRSGDSAAFGEIYDSHFRKIYAFIYYKTHHRETAQDLTADAFLKALRGIGGFDPKRGSISSWLYKIARNTVIDHYRAAKPHRNIEDAWDVSAGDDVEADVDAVMRLAEIRGHIRRLKPEHRDIVIMRVWQEMSYAEIAGALGRSEGSCKMTFSRAMKSLREGMTLTLFMALLTGSIWIN